MSEPTVRLYGLLPMTRRRYIWQVAVGFCLAAGILALWWTRWPPLRADLAAMQGEGVARVIWCVDAVPWVILAVAAVQAFEAWVVMGMFARKGKEPPAATGVEGVSPAGPQRSEGIGPPGPKAGG